MESLRKALQQYEKAVPVTMGAHGTKRWETTDQPASPEALTLQQSLNDLSHRNEKYFVIGIVMAVLLFVALLVTAFLQLTKPNADAMQLASPLFGTSAAVVVWRMFKVWREKSYTDCILALVPNVDEETLKTIVAVLVTKL